LERGLATGFEADYSDHMSVSSRPPHKVYYCQVTFYWTTSFLSDISMLTRERRFSTPSGRAAAKLRRGNAFSRLRWPRGLQQLQCCLERYTGPIRTAPHLIADLLERLIKQIGVKEHSDFGPVLRHERFGRPSATGAAWSPPCTRPGRADRNAASGDCGRSPLERLESPHGSRGRQPEALCNYSLARARSYPGATGTNPSGGSQPCAATYFYCS